MKRIPTFSIIILISLVVVVCGWKENRKYNYKVITKIQTKSFNELWSDDDASQARLSIHPVNDDVLIGRFRRIENAKVENNELPMDKPFKIELKNGVIDTLYVHRDTQPLQIFHLQLITNIIANQFRVDTNSIDFKMDGESASFSKNESTATGQCETTYEISPMSEDVARSRPDLVPLPELRGTGIFLDVIKTRNLIDCENRSNFTRNPLSSTPISEVTRTILSGPLDDLTVQSSVTDIKSADIVNATIYNIISVKLTLLSIVTDTEYPPLPEKRFVNVDSILGHVTVHVAPASMAQQLLDENENKKWSGCFNRVVSADSICVSVFGAEWEATYFENCGILDTGRMVMCERRYPGCESTACFGLFTQHLCDERLPVHKGVFADCAPGLWRWRCCPN